MLAFPTRPVQNRINGVRESKESDEIYSQDDSSAVKRKEQRCQVFRNANVVRGEPLGGGTWPALNHNDIYAPHPLKVSKRFFVFRCKIFLLSNKMFLIFLPVRERRWLVRGWLAAILPLMFKSGFFFLFFLKWLECELDFPSCENKPSKLISTSLYAGGWCSLSCNSRATRKMVLSHSSPTAAAWKPKQLTGPFLQRWPQTHTLAAAGGGRLVSN